MTRTAVAIAAPTSLRVCAGSQATRRQRLGPFQRADLLHSPAARHVGNVPPLP